MPSISLRKALYDELIRHDEEPAERVDELAREYLEEEYDFKDLER